MGLQHGRRNRKSVGRGASGVPGISPFLIIPPGAPQSAFSLAVHPDEAPKEFSRRLTSGSWRPLTADIDRSHLLRSGRLPPQGAHERLCLAAVHAVVRRNKTLQPSSHLSRVRSEDLLDTLDVPESCRWRDSICEAATRPGPDCRYIGGHRRVRERYLAYFRLKASGEKTSFAGAVSRSRRWKFDSSPWVEEVDSAPLV